jgi:xanthine dehydrogenase small subunit
MSLKLSVNGQVWMGAVDPRTTLLEVLREQLDLRGTTYGCGEGECGACTVIIDGRTVCSCLAVAGSVAGSEVTTIEGLANDPAGVSLFKSFTDHGAVQCGFCTPGLVLSAWNLLAHGGQITSETIKDALGGNLCRCTGYTKIINAVAACASNAPRSPLSRRIGKCEEISDPGGYWRPTSLESLFSCIESFRPRVALIAGGTDLMVQHEHHLGEMLLIDISAVQELSGIEDRGDFISIGATTRWTEIRRSKLIQNWTPLLSIAAAEIGGIQIQNRGTIGGNVVNASPAADSLPALYAYDARAVVVGGRTTRTLPVDELIRGPRQTELRPGEVLTEIRLPKLKGEGNRIFFFEKVGSRKAQTITKGSVAFDGWLRNGRLSGVRIALGAVGPTIIRATDAERALEHDCGGENLKKTVALVSAAAKPIDDIRSTASYRRALVGGLLARGLMKSDPLFAENFELSEQTDENSES